MENHKPEYAKSILHRDGICPECGQETSIFPDLHHRKSMADWKEQLYNRLWEFREMTENEERIYRACESFIFTEIVKKLIKDAANTSKEFMKVEQDGTGNALFSFKTLDFEQQLREKWL